MSSAEEPVDYKKLFEESERRRIEAEKRAERAEEAKMQEKRLRIEAEEEARRDKEAKERAEEAKMQEKRLRIEAEEERDRRSSSTLGVSASQPRPPPC